MQARGSQTSGAARALATSESTLPALPMPLENLPVPRKRCINKAAVRGIAPRASAHLWVCSARTVRYLRRRLRLSLKAPFAPTKAPPPAVTGES